MRLFLGIPISEEVKAKIRPIVKALVETKADLSLVSLENLHLTVKFLGWVDEQKIPEIKKATSKICQEFSNFSLNFSGVSVFPSLKDIKVVWIGLQSLEMVKLMQKFNSELDYIHKYDYLETKPHLTLARVKSVKNKDQLQEILLKFKEHDFGEMNVDKVVLFQSTLTRKGPIYNVVEEFSLKLE